MKKTVIATLALLLSLTAAAQSEQPGRADFLGRDSIRLKGYNLPDSLAHLSPWNQETRRIPGASQSKPAVTMTSLVAVPWEKTPARISVLPNNTLRLGRHFTISVGQAWSNGPFPDAFLDARTLSFPMPR